MMDTLLPLFPIVAIFLILLGVMIFLRTYIHFPKMAKSERVLLAFRNAFYIVLLIMILCVMFLVLLQYFI